MWLQRGGRGGGGEPAWRACARRIGRPPTPLHAHTWCRAATVTAATAARVLVCTREGFDHHLGSLAEIRNVWRFEALRRVGAG